MKQIILIISVLTVLFISGCLAEMELTVPLKDGRTAHARYRRWGSQSLEGVKLTAPEGWELSIQKQKSDFTIGFDAGVASVKAGGGK